MSSMRPNVAIMTRHPVHYLAPAFRSMSELGSVRPTVFYWSSASTGQFDREFGRHVRWNTDLHSGYKWWEPTCGKPARSRFLQILATLRTTRPDVIICFGWTAPNAIAGLVFSQLSGTPCLLYGDTNGREETGGARRRLRRVVMRLLLRRVAGAISTGTANSEFYLTHGLKRGQLHSGVLPIELEPFSRRSPERAAPAAGSPRGPLMIGYAGKLVPHKGVDDLLRAVALLPRSRRWRLSIIGDGPSLGDLRFLAGELGLDDQVEFLGFKNSDEMPAALSRLDVLVMPSHREPRGLVAIEAMASEAVPVVSSASGVWGDGDAVQHGVTGFVYPCGDHAALSATLDALIMDDGMRSRVSRAAREMAFRFGPDEFAKTASAAVRSVCGAEVS